MILEAVIHQSHRLCGSATPVGIITILSKKGEDENNEFMGLTNRIRSTIKSSEQRLDSKIDANKSEIKAAVKSEIDVVNSKIDANKSEIKAVNDKIDRLLALMEDKK